MSVDPVGAAPSWPQSWNRYSYVLGNPLRFVDPEGLQAATIEEEITVVDERFLFPTSFVEFTFFGSFLRRLSFVAGLSLPQTRYRVFEQLHQRRDVQRVFACLGRRGLAVNFEAAGLMHVNSRGELEFSMRIGEGTEVEIGDVSGPRLIGVAHTHPVNGPTG